MQTMQGDFHPTRFEDIAVTIDFHCNSACRFCIVQEGMNRYKGLPFERFQQLVDENRTSNKYHRVIFTGGEVTLEASLPQFARYARDSGSFPHIRLQTNGRKLADPSYARSLVDCGINEFFVSLHGPDAAVQDGISQRPGSFDEAISGLDNLRSLGVRLLTNTVINTLNVARLADIVDVVCAHGAERMEFWNYLPMEDHADEQNLIAPLSELMPSLARALDRCREKGVRAVVKYVPRCLLGHHEDALDNGQADVLIVESFWDQFPRFTCLYEAVCAHSETCLGLHHDYINKFGWEETRLRPAPRTTPWQEPRLSPRGQPEDDAPRAHPAWQALVEGIAGLERFELGRNQARYTFRLQSARVDVVLVARDETAPAFARSASFNIFYSGLEGNPAPAEVEALMRATVAQVTNADHGQLSLDARKGLLEIRKKPR
jgi:molybdenum cofactor biosynthesis enzyme MoaA